MEILENRALVVQTAHPDTITALIKKSVKVDDNSVAVYWGYDEAVVLRNMGYEDVPSPITRDYQWSGKLTPFAHQKATAEFLSLRPKAFCFSQAGTGKTASVIWAADYLMKIGKVSRVLILCPLSIMRAAWQQDLFKFAMHRSCSVCHGSAKRREQILKEGSEFVILNFDGLSTVQDAVMAGGFDLIVVDEATAYKNPSTNRWKVLKKVSDSVARLWMLTGTPAAQSPVDAYGLAKLVNPLNTPKWAGAFRDKVMYQITQYRWVPRPQAAEIVHNILQPAIRFEKAQCLDLPPVTYMERDAPLTPMQQRYYNELKTQLHFTVGADSVTAVNAAVGINKLLQIASGAVYTEDGSVMEFDVSNRLNVVLEAVEEASNKVLIFVPFTHTIELLKRKLEAADIPCGVINGAVSMNARSEIIKDFQEKADPKVLIIQPQAAAHGITLTAADTIIWYAPITSVEMYIQANARIDRPGQFNPMTVIHIQGSPVESRLYGMLQNKINDHTRLVDLYMQEVDDMP